MPADTMKIQSIETYVLRMPLGERKFYSSQCAFPERNSLLVAVRTDTGLCGWGEGGQCGPAQPVASCIDEILAPMIIGRDPLTPAVIWEDLYSATRDFGQKGTYVEAISAIDIALWDILGKELGAPIHRLLGGARRQAVNAYATGCYYREEDMSDPEAGASRMREESAGYAAQGFATVKVKIGLLSLDQDRKRLKAVREAVGDEVTILADANHAYNRFTAIRMAHELEELGAGWFEEPVVPEDREAYRAVREATSVPVTGGECEFTRYGFRDLFSGGCVDIAQPDVCACGGISELMKIQAMASAYGVWVLPHVWGSAVALAAALQFLATVPLFPHTAHPVPLQNEPMVEFDRNPNALRDELAETPFTLKDGRLAVPQGPGLGIEVREEIVERYST